MPADVHTGGQSTSQSGERAGARASSELRLLDLDDLCLSEILVRAVPPQLPWESAGRDPFVNDDPADRREGESVVYCGRVLRVCTRFRDALLSRATGRWVCNSNALLRFAPRLRRLEIARDSNQLPWRAERSGDGLTIAPPALAHLTTVTQLELRSRRHQMGAGMVTGVVALPLLRDLELWWLQIKEGPELQGLAALTALTRLHLPHLAAQSTPPDSLECFSRLQALQTFGAPYARLASASILRFIAALTALSALHLQYVYFNPSVKQGHRHDALLEIASEARGLKELRYLFEYGTVDGFSCITRLPQLTVLNLTQCLSRLSERDLRCITALPRLRKLALTGEGCARVPPLRELTALESLFLEVDEPSGGQRLAGLSALTHLRLHLRLRPGVAGFEGLATEALATLSSLRELALCDFCFDSTAGAAVGALHGLRRLLLRNCKVTDGALGALTQLHELTLEGGETEAGTMTELALLTGLRALTVVRLSDPFFDCAGVVMLTQLTRLELHFESQDSSRVQLPSLVDLPRLTSLRDLTACAPSIGQQGLESMAALHSLTRLRVSCKRSFTGTVSCLTALQQLVMLHLSIWSCVATEDVAALACALPELRRLHAAVEDVPSGDSEVLTRLAQLRGALYDTHGQSVELGLGLSVCVPA